MKKQYLAKPADLVENNLGLVDFVIKKYYAWTGLTKSRQQTQHMVYLTYDDLYSEGVIGLIAAKRKWLIRKKSAFSFTTFAVWYIRSAIRLAIFKTGLSIVKIPRHVFRKKRKIDNYITKNNKSYHDLYEEGIISFTTLSQLNKIQNSMQPKKIEDCVIDGEDVDLKAYIDLFNGVCNDDVKTIARKILWKVIRCIYIQHRQRNYTIVALKLGLLANRNPTSFQTVEKILLKKNKKISQSSLRKIYSVVMPKFRQELKIAIGEIDGQ